MPTWIAEICEHRRDGNTQGGPGGSLSRSPVLLAAAPRRRAGGFTLLELAVVLFIIGLLVTLAVPRLGEFGSARLDSTARRLAALARYLHGEAVFRSQLYRLHYDLDQHTYWVTVLTATQDATEFVVDASPLTQPVSLPPSVTFADVQVSGTGRVSSGQVYTHFYPQGYTDPTLIHLRDQYSRIVTVTIPPLTGEPKVEEGYVPAVANP